MPETQPRAGGRHLASATPRLERDRARATAVARAALGRTPREVEPIPAGLGHRRFLRLHFDDLEPATLVARLEPEPDEATPERPDASASRDHGTTREPEPPAWLPEPALEPLRGFLERAGLPVPRSHAHDPAAGVDLLEDVGDRTLGSLSGAARERGYAQACALLPRLQALSGSPEVIPAFGRRFDAALVAGKAWKWLHWTIPLLLDRPASEPERRGVEALFSQLFATLSSAPMRLAHRDFKAENLHRVGADRLVMIDVQGAFLAPPEYDLVCLLHDLQVELDEKLVAELAERTRRALPDAPEPEVFAARFDALTLLRLCKDVSHVVHAGRRRGDARRWHEIPNGLALIERSAARLAGGLPETRVLSSVIGALTRAAESVDSRSQGG